LSVKSVPAPTDPYRKPEPSPAGFCGLFTHRWTAPLLAHLSAAGGGGKFVTLERALGVSKDSLARTLTVALEAGLVARNSGHGHPLRPEYVLTPAGAAAAQAVAGLQAAQAALALSPGALGRWGLPTLGVLHPQAARFNVVARALAPVTPRALTAAFATLSQNALITRTVAPSGPIAATYAVTVRGAPLAHAAFLAASSLAQ
jgi:DNA-binding HxlR family transcriptional regulator